MVSLLGGPWTRAEQLARVGRLDQVEGVQLVEAGDGAERGAARLAGYGTSWHGDECVLWAEGEVVHAAIFGVQLVSRRRVEADLGELVYPADRGACVSEASDPDYRELTGPRVDFPRNAMSTI